LPRSTVVLAGNRKIDVSKFDSDKSIKNEEVTKLLAQDLWKKEDKKKKQVAA